MRWPVPFERYGTLLASAALAGAFVVTVFYFTGLVRAEAKLAAAILAAVFGDAHTLPGSSVIVFTGPDDELMGIEISMQNAAVLLIPLLILIATATIWLCAGAIRPALLSLGIATAALVLQNQLRIAVAAVAANVASPEYRYFIGAAVLGSMVTVICLALPIVLFFFSFIRLRKKASVVETPEGTR